MMVRTRPPFGLRSGLIYPIENDQWMINLSGAGDERPPTDEALFMDYIKNLLHPALYQAVKDAEAISPMYTYQRTENRLRHFERLKRWPENFIMLGDAACAFNPTYGQGMSVAALEAQALDTVAACGAEHAGLSASIAEGGTRSVADGDQRGFAPAARRGRDAEPLRQNLSALHRRVHLVVRH